MPKDGEQRALDGQGNAIVSRGGTFGAGVQLANPTTGDIVEIGATAVADWPLTTVRYYAVDYDGGNDANVGYSDVSMAAAGAVALKTLEELRARVPAAGAGRSVVVAIKARAAGATYRNKADTANADLDFLWGIGGYRNVLVRGTGDVATAGATAFANDSADKAAVGAQIVAGTEATGYRVTGAPTARTWDVVRASDGGAPGLAAEPTLIGKKIRFDVATPTVALRNKGGMIWSNDTDTITIGQNTAATPAAGGAGIGDVFYIEEPALRVNNVIVNYMSGDGIETSSSTAGNLTMVGLKALGRTKWEGSSRRMQVAGYEAAGAVTAFSTGQVVLLNSWADEAGTLQSFWGPAGRFDESVTLSGLRTALIASAAFTKTTFAFSLFDALAFGVGGGCYFSGQVGLNGCGLGLPPSSRAGGTGGPPTRDFGRATSTTAERARLIGPGANSTPLMIGHSNVAVYGVDITGATGAAILATGVGMTYTFDDCVGSTGNLTVGIDFNNARYCKATLGQFAANTITGASGDIQLSGPALTSHAGLLITNVADDNGNDIQGLNGHQNGSGGVVVGSSVYRNNGAGSALAIGTIVSQVVGGAGFTRAQANNAANATGVHGVMITTPPDNNGGYSSNSGYLWVQMDAAPVVGNICYLSDLNAGQGRDTPPPVAATNQKLRLGWIVAALGTLARVAWNPELIPVVSDGLAP